MGVSHSVAEEHHLSDLFVAVPVLDLGASVAGSVPEPSFLPVDSFVTSLPLLECGCSTVVVPCSFVAYLDPVEDLPPVASVHVEVYFVLLPMGLNGQ